MTVFEAYITNLGKYAEGQLMGETLKFPATTEEVQSLLKNIGVDGVRYEEFFITAFDGDVMGLYDYLTEYENLDELNHLAHLISKLDSDEIETLEAALNKGDHTSSVADIINLVHNLDCYDLHPGVTDDETLGRIYVEDMELLNVPDNVLPYFDFEAYGRDIDYRSNAARGIDEIPTIHEGVAAQALERKGIISDRCELNRQIKADNALLRELKAAVRKLMDAVKNTIPALAEATEKLRENMIIFRYQLNHIAKGKRSMRKYIKSVSPELERYTGLVQQIKEKSKERKTLVAEKKELLIYHVKRHKALAVRITELTEDLEELRSEESLLLQKFEYAEDADAEAFRKDIATMEAGLKKLEAQEQKYSAEMDKALSEYAELKAQAAELDPVELYAARQVLRPAQEKTAEERQVRQMVMQRQAAQQKRSLRSVWKKNDFER